MANLYSHQVETLKFYDKGPYTYNASDPGTGKTLTCIEHIRQHGYRALVFAPKSILRAAWGKDFNKFAPEIKYFVLDAKNRTLRAIPEAQVYITNHDAAGWVLEYINALPSFDLLVIDEATAFKHRTAQRSKAMARVAHRIPNRILMSGTPSPNGVLDLWHQYYILDGGQRLGTSFWRFRSITCEPHQVGPAANHVKWVPKPGAEEAVADLVSDITIRYKLEECLDLPANVQYTRPFVLSPTLRRAYERLRDEMRLELATGAVTAVNAASKLQKLLQLLSGSVYDDRGKAQTLGIERYELVADLVEERPASLVLFHWRHQREALEKILKKRKVSYGVIDGSVPSRVREEVVQRFQAGELQTVLAHPQSAGHGLTLTRAVATIWCGPTYNAEHWLQANRRIYRAGQDKRTETILVVADGTIENRVYKKLSDKLSHIEMLSEVLA